VAKSHSFSVSGGAWANEVCGHCGGGGGGGTLEQHSH